MPNKNIDEKNNTIDLKHAPPFETHALPTDEELKEEEIEDSLMEIYQDGKGGMVNVSKFDIKKRHAVLNFFMTLIFIGLVGYGGWYGYKNYYLPRQASSDAVEITINAPKETIAGDTLVYAIDYKNLNNVDLNDVEIKLTYPDNFIFLDASPLATAKNNDWQFGSLGAHRSGHIEIKGKIIGAKDYLGILGADLSYRPAGVSLSFKKSTSYETLVTDTGVSCTFDAPNSVLAGKEDDINLKCTGDNNGFIKNFRLTALASENFTIVSATGTSAEKIGPGTWTIKNIGPVEQDLDIRFKINDKKAPTEDVTFKFEYSEDGAQFYKFQENKLTFDVVKNNLNLNLILNGSTNDQGIDFGQKLNYSIVYANKGESDMGDVVLMAVFKSDILDTGTLVDKNGGKVVGNTISWSKDEIPALASIGTGAEGTVDFSLNVMPLEKVKPAGTSFDANKNYAVESYVQFNIGSSTKSQDSSDTKSNTIVAKINSDLNLDEQVRYFSADNIPVGSGPLPPKVGEITSFKVYWVLSNNLHELSNTKIETTLPQYVQWVGKNITTVGTISYDESTRKVTWDIGRMPLGVDKMNAEFSISINPTEDDKDKILVLMPGSNVSATDVSTNQDIKKMTKAKTTRLEDDEIANSDGRVVGK